MGETWIIKGDSLLWKIVELPQ